MKIRIALGLATIAASSLFALSFCTQSPFVFLSLETSPVNSYAITTKVDGYGLTFSIIDPQHGNEVIFANKRPFSVNSATAFYWSSKDYLWVYSGDVGLYYYIPLDRTHWKEVIITPESKDPIPLAIKNFRPNLFK